MSPLFELSVLFSLEFSVELFVSLELSDELFVSLEFPVDVLLELSFAFSVLFELLVSVPFELEESEERPTPVFVELSVPRPESELLSPATELPPSSDPPNDPDRSELVSVLLECSKSIETMDSTSAELLLSLEVVSLDRD